MSSRRSHSLSSAASHTPKAFSLGSIRPHDRTVRCTSGPRVRGSACRKAKLTRSLADPAFLPQVEAAIADEICADESLAKLASQFFYYKCVTLTPLLDFFFVFF